MVIKGEQMKKSRIKKTILIMTLFSLMFLPISAKAGTWLGGDKLYKLGYGESGTTAYSNYSTSMDNLYARLWNGGIADSNDNLYVNSGYVSGDEDATLYFNATNQYLRYEYLNSKNLSSFLLSERTWVNKTFSSATTDFGNDVHGYAFRVGGTWDISSWSGSGKAAVNLLVQTENKINDATPTNIELAGIGSHVWNLTANSKAVSLGVDTSVVKQSPCVTDNTFLAMNALVCSDRDPTDPMHGSGYRSYCQDDNGNTSVRQHSAFLAMGARGWKYGFYYLDTDGATVLASVDQNGNANFYGNVASYVATFVNYDYSAGDEDAVIYFNSTSETITWDHGNSRFEISDDLYVEGTLKVNSLTGANPTGKKAVYYDTGTGELVYDNT